MAKKFIDVKIKTSYGGRSMPLDKAFKELGKDMKTAVEAAREEAILEALRQVSCPVHGPLQIASRDVNTDDLCCAAGREALELALR